jgi:membrane protease YdiL (CAAX protease family)
MENTLSTLATLLPLFAILLVANAAERVRSAGGSAEGWRLFAYVLDAGLMALIAASGLVILAADLLSSIQPSALNESGLLGGQAAPGAVAAFPFAGAANLALLGWGFLLSGILGIVLLLPPVRRAAARVIPIDAENTVHAVALSFSMVVVVNMLSTVGLGLEQLSQIISETEEASGVQFVTMASLWAQQLLFAALGIVGVGWPVRRSLGQTLERLGLVVPSVNQVLLGVGVAFVLVGMVVAAQILSALLGFAPNETVENLSEQLLGSIYTSPWGVLTIGLAAAIGEETLMRGAAQPRLGLVLTSFLFALLHSQYGITFSTWVVFAVGLVLGWIRIRHNTTTSMVTHATYNIILASMAFMSIDYLERLR